MFSTVWLLVTL